MRIATTIRLLFVAAALAAATPGFAVRPDEILPDPKLETRARVLSHELRCMVCQNQSIDDSDAPLAHDLRMLVRERLKAGDTDQQVLDFLVARYGEFVLLKPRFERQNMLLWLLAPLLLIGGGLALWLQIRRRSRNGADVPAPPLTPDEETRLAALMADEAKS
jgi:cytochrome c-type biogenesis protein CcmH